jgi:hypothetical protein
MRIYSVSGDQAERLSKFFFDQLLPVQLKHGARLVGRWRSTDDRVIALWEYDSTDHFESVQTAVSGDPDSIAAQALRASAPPLYDSREELMLTTDPRSKNCE